MIHALQTTTHAVLQTAAGSYVLLPFNNPHLTRVLEVIRDTYRGEDFCSYFKIFQTLSTGDAVILMLYSLQSCIEQNISRLLSTNNKFICDGDAYL